MNTHTHTHMEEHCFLSKQQLVLIGGTLECGDEYSKERKREKKIIYALKNEKKDINVVLSLTQKS